MSVNGLRVEVRIRGFLMKNEKSDSIDDEIIEVDVDINSEDTIPVEEIEIDHEEEQKKKIEKEIVELIKKKKIDQLIEKYQNLTTMLASENKLKEEYLHTAQHVQAEFENYKKRVYKDQEFSNYRNKASILQKLLTVYEDIDRIQVQTNKETDINIIRDALKLVFKNITNTFNDLGVKIINPQDEIFDPKYHEALYTVENENLSNNKIIEVVSKGFMLDNMVLKPARVVISKLPKKKEDENST